MLNNDINEIPALAEFIDTMVEEIALDPSLGMSLNLALEEAVTNVILYAYPEGTSGTVTITVEGAGDTLTFIISDKGVPFDPTQKEDADITLSAEERPIGGLGIFLVKQLMDDVRYEYTDGQNILTLKKTIVQLDE
ncbi:MAG: ATP-binding protein [Prevotella sp.]|nr:ATP-binding protein [Prevotella sp.]